MSNRYSLKKAPTQGAAKNPFAVNEDASNRSTQIEVRSATNYGNYKVGSVNKLPFEDKDMKARRLKAEREARERINEEERNAKIAAETKARELAEQKRIEQEEAERREAEYKAFLARKLAPVHELLAEQDQEILLQVKALMNNVNNDILDQIEDREIQIVTNPTLDYRLEYLRPLRE